MAKLVYDFTEGNKDLKDLLGGKGANLAEMTNLGLPVPPGFIITTEACRQYLREGAVPGRARRRGQRAPAAAGKEDGPAARRPRGPAARQRQVGGQVLHARHDGDGAEHRPVRRVGGRPGQAVGQRAVRLGLLPPPDPDVRQDRARHRRRGLRARDRRGEAGQGHEERSRPRRGRPARDRGDLQGHRARARGPRVPAGPAGADGPRGARRVPLVERRPGDPVPPPGADPGRPRHRGEHRGDGLRQPGHGLRHRRRVHPRPRLRAAGRLRRLPAERAGRGRRRRHPQHRPAAGPGADRPRLLRAADGHHADPGEPLPGPVRHRVHHRARQALDAADPGGQAHRRAPRSGSPPSSWTRASSTWTRRSPGSPATSSPS